jgi:hypothetical protein
MPASRSVVSVLLTALGDFSLHPQGHDGRRATGLTLAPPWCRSIEESSTPFSSGRAKEATMPTATDRDFLDMPISDVRRII